VPIQREWKKMCIETELAESLGIDERKLFDDDVCENLASEFSEK
jgi:hypothetical protein